MSVLRTLDRWLYRLGACIVRPNPEPQPGRSDDLMAMVDATREGRPAPLPKRRPGMWPTAELSRIGQQNQGHQIHRNPDVPCDCCAALDYELAGVIDDMGGRI